MSGLSSTNSFEIWWVLGAGEIFPSARSRRAESSRWSIFENELAVIVNLLLFYTSINASLSLRSLLNGKESHCRKWIPLSFLKLFGCLQLAAEIAHVILFLSHRKIQRKSKPVLVQFISLFFAVFKRISMEYISSHSATQCTVGRKGSFWVIHNDWQRVIL